MKTDYNNIAKEYQLSKLQPWRRHVEAYTFFKLAGDLSNMQVLDLACGDGFYTRQLKLRGAAQVEGVDISKEMIRLAEVSETETPLGITYYIQNVLNLQLDKTYDLITASYLLNYAKSREELLQFSLAISRHLNPGGRFITINSNPDYRSPVDTMFKYGFTRENKNYDEGGEVIYRFYQDDGSHIEVVNYHLEKTTHKKAMTQSGLSNIKWHPVELSPEAHNGSDNDFWQSIINTQPIIGLTCERS
ncbi:MAG: methyltransferase domain-containing protein [Bacteroidota bacterium]